MIKKLALLTMTALVLSAVPASAITSGQPDDGEHPYVGELILFDADFVDPSFDAPGAWFTCSGTMLSSKVIVTAGHCTYGVGLDGDSTRTRKLAGSGGNDIWFDVSENAHFAGFPSSADYGSDQNQQLYQDRAAFLNASPFWHRGTAYPHPEHVEALFYLHDAGVVVLKKSIAMDTYGAIPTVGYLDQYTGDPHHLLEVVGYGLTEAGPFTEEGGDTRLKGDVKINNFGSQPPDTYMLLSNNNGVPHQGGTCFGDSGGPTFDDTNSNLVVAVTSFAVNPTCAGIGGAYRLDEPDDLAFLASFGITP